MTKIVHSLKLLGGLPPELHWSVTMTRAGQGEVRYINTMERFSPEKPDFQKSSQQKIFFGNITSKS